MTRTDEEREVVYLERDGGGLPWLLLGFIAGAAAGVLFAPHRGAKTRRLLEKRLRRARELAEARMEVLTGRGDEEPAEGGEEEFEEEVVESRGSSRQEVESRLAEARARRRGRGAAPAGGESGA